MNKKVSNLKFSRNTKAFGKKLEFIVVISWVEEMSEETLYFGVYQ